MGSVLDALAVGVVVCDAEGRLVLANRTARRLYPGTGRTGLPLSVLFGVTPLADAHGEPLPSADRMPLLRALAEDDVDDVELQIFPDHGPPTVVRCSARALHDGGGAVTGAVATFVDVTEGVRAAAELSHRAAHDPLTDLPNRTVLVDRISLALARQDRRRPGPAVLLIDLDDFKPVNDAHGHEVGDRVLVEIARRMRAVVRPVDTIARLGGDEFVVVVDEFDQTGGDDPVGGLHALWRRLLQAIVAPVAIGGGVSVHVGASAGAAISVPGDDPDALLRRADRAMYTAKAQGGARIVVLEPR
jgi:diguanylate cyclase (GGDEF)-like protein